MSWLRRALLAKKLSPLGWHLDCGAPKNDLSTQAPFLTLPLTHTAPSHQIHRETSRSFSAQAQTLIHDLFVLTIMGKRTCSDMETADESAQKDVQLEQHEEAQPKQKANGLDEYQKTDFPCFHKTWISDELPKYQPAKIGTFFTPILRQLSVKDNPMV